MPQLIGDITLDSEHELQSVGDLDRRSEEASLLWLAHNQIERTHTGWPRKPKQEAMDSMMKATDMNFYFSYLLSKKSPPNQSPTGMQNILGEVAHRTPIEWTQTITHHDHQREYIVTEVHLYKEEAPFPDLQHEYILLIIRSRASSEAYCVKASRSIKGNSFLARMGIHGPADDTVTTLGNHSLVNVAHTLAHSHKLLCRLTWTPEHAPPLLNISLFIRDINQAIPHYWLLKSSCYAFARALLETIHLTYDGTAELGGQCFLTRRSYFLGTIPAGATRAQSLARALSIAYLTGMEIEGNFALFSNFLFTNTIGKHSGTNKRARPQKL